MSTPPPPLRTRCEHPVKHFTNPPHIPITSRDHHTGPRILSLPSHDKLYPMSLTPFSNTRASQSTSHTRDRKFFFLSYTSSTRPIRATVSREEGNQRYTIPDTQHSPTPAFIQASHQPKKKKKKQSRAPARDRCPSFMSHACTNEPHNKAYNCGTGTSRLSSDSPDSRANERIHRNRGVNLTRLWLLF